jgi:hypothetical protein
MLGKLAAVLLALATCWGEDPPRPDTCRVADYGCYPADPRADRVCAYLCGQGPRAAHCGDYAPADYTFCAGHPGVLRSKGGCTLDGLPNWISHCMPGPAPAMPARLRAASR